MTPWVTVGHPPVLLALAPDFRLNPVRRLIPAARGGEVIIPCQPRAAPKAVVLWSKGTEILVNSSRYNLYPTPSNSYPLILLGAVSLPRLQGVPGLARSALSLLQSDCHSRWHLDHKKHQSVR